MSLLHQRILAGVDRLDGYVQETGPLRGPWRGKNTPKELPKDSAQHDLAPPKDPTPPKDDAEKQKALHKHTLKKMGHAPDDDDEDDDPEEIDPPKAPSKKTEALSFIFRK